MLVEVVTRVVALTIVLGLGFVAYRRNKKSATNRLLALLTVSIFLWGVANEVSLAASTPAATLLWIRLTMAFAVPMSLLFLVLMHTFPRATLDLKPRTTWLLLLTGGATMALAVSPWLFTELTGGVGAAAQPVPGPAMVAFVATVVGANILAVLALIMKNIQLVGLARLQARYFMLGTVLTFGLIIGAILVPVAAFQYTALVPFQSTFMLPFVAVTTYAIIRYRFLDIRAVMLRSVSFSILVATFAVIYSAILIFAVPALSAAVEIPASFLAGAGALLAVLLARYVQDALRQLTDRYFWQQQTNYRLGLVKTSERLSRTIDDKQVNDILLDALTVVVRSSAVTIFLAEAKDGRFAPRISTKGTPVGISVPGDHELIEYLQQTPEPLVADELPFRQEQATRSAEQETLAAVAKTLDWLDAAVVVPLFIDRGITGFISLGTKQTGVPYSQDDIEFLASVAPQAATALENARLYKESLEFGKRLEEEVKRATQELEIANEQLKDLDKAKSEFLSIASHQLYTPLTAIRGYLSMLQEGDFGQVTDQQAPIVEILDKSADRLITLIKNLLDISRIESGRLELNLESVDLATMAKELVQDLMPNAMKKNLDLVFQPPAEKLPHVVADQERLRQVMLNFIDNAIKYTEQGNIAVSVEQQGDELHFAVTDTGKGLSEEEINRLFTKFTRVGGASRFHTEGTGLGLYVARQIVKEHRGDVSVSSPGKGQGSSFGMRMPIEGSPRSLNLGDHATVVIKAAEAQGAVAAPA